MQSTANGHGFERLFEESFNRFFDSLHRYALTLVKNSESASDAVQTVFIKWWETKTMVADLDEARKYLFTAVYRSSLNVIRNEKVKQLHVTNYFQEQESETKFQDTAELEELDLKIKLAIDSLPPQCRTIFMKSRFEERKYAEIATDMNLSVKTIEVQMGKALKILREKLSIN
jgi:RNA polymerase sigma-70 factor (ECF subfamily)